MGSTNTCSLRGRQLLSHDGTDKWLSNDFRIPSRISRSQPVRGAKNGAGRSRPATDTPFIYGMYGTSNACPAINFNGNNASTDSYTSAGGQTYAQTVSNTGGDIGTNGGVSVGNGNIGGIVGVTAAACATPISISNNGSMVGTVACPSGNLTACYLPVPYSFPVPPVPSPAPPNTSTTPNTCTTTTTTGHGHNQTTTTTSYDCLTPGTYGNISITSALTLAP